MPAGGRALLSPSVLATINGRDDDGVRETFPRTPFRSSGVDQAFARARLASIAPSSQMLCLRVSGITKIAIRNITAGTTIG
jgi:hypothetical protein